MADLSDTAKPRGLTEIMGAPFRRLAEWWRNGRERRRLRDEFAALEGQGQLDVVLQEAGASRGSVEAILRAHPDTPKRLTAMMRRLGLSRADIRDDGTLHDVELTCTLCEAPGECRRWLRSGATTGYEDFCPNAETFNRLRGRQQ